MSDEQKLFDSLENARFEPDTTSSADGTGSLTAHTADGVLVFLRNDDGSGWSEFDPEADKEGDDLTEITDQRLLRLLEAQMKVMVGKRMFSEVITGGDTMAISDQLISRPGVEGHAIFVCGRCLIPVQDKTSQSKFSKVCQNCGVLGEWDSEARRDAELAPLIGDERRARRWARFRFRLRVSEGEYKGFYVCGSGIGHPIAGTGLTLQPEELAATICSEKGVNEMLAILRQRGLKIEVIESI